MVEFLKYMNRKTWKVVIKGWEHPVVKEKDGKVVTNLKPEEDWSKEEDELSLGNSKALNDLFNGVDKNIFRLINTCTMAKDAWEILRTTHEGTSKVKISRLQLLTTRFKNLNMIDDESIHDFHMNVLEIENASSSLGEKISKEKMVRKILSDRSEKKNKSITFVSNTEDEENQCDLDIDEGISNAIVLLGRQFNKVLKGMDRKSRPNVKNISYDISKNNDFQRRTRTEDKSNQGVVCLLVDDDNSESEPENESAKHVTTLTRRYDYDEDSCDEEVSYDELATSYKEMCIKSEENTQTGGKLLRWTCHYCGNFGHLKSLCFKLYGYPRSPTEPRANQVVIETRKEWIPKLVTTSLIAHTSLRASVKEDWYFDSGWSRHMTGVKKFLVDIKSYSISYVTFGDGDKCEIKGVGR
ncbi:uncharacterized protein LOC127093915 [Lathyrus oleraceus]|uniref:uncharacterized protein LOC127093915 n=1 Tax=Pisum sativum TaxID=3888 RepID=UPI0021D0DDB9|nr:uncharacterized protein LOC127093915 [Pisum sativum]